MFIIPLNSSITPLKTITQENVKLEGNEAEGGSFSSIFTDLIKNVEDTNRVVQEDSIKATLGEIDDLHTLTINAEKAAMALEVFVAVKNTAVDAYKEIIQMNV